MKKGRIKVMQGNEACVEAALLAGCRFFAGYPITPASEILEGHGPAAAAGRWLLPAGGGRDRGHRVGGRGVLGRGQGHDRHERAGLLPHAGRRRPGGQRGVALRHRQRSEGRARLRASPPRRPRGISTRRATAPTGIIPSSPFALPPPRRCSTTRSGPSTWPSGSGSRSSSSPTRSSPTSGKRCSSPTRTELEFVERKKPTVPMEEFIPFQAGEDDVPPMPAFNTGYKIPVISQAKSLSGNRGNAKEAEAFIQPDQPQGGRPHRRIRRRPHLRGREGGDRLRLLRLGVAGRRGAPSTWPGKKGSRSGRWK